MKLRNILYVFICLISFNAVAQEEINNYKYILVPKSFEFLKGNDQYQVNSLTKFLFDKHGYTAFLEGSELPADLEADPCLALTAEVVKASGGFLITKLQIDLLNCRNTVVASSKVGKSKDKDFKQAYHESIREAFETFKNFEYNYKPSNRTVVSSAKAKTANASQPSISEANNAEIERLKREVEALKQKEQMEKEATVAAVEEELVEEVQTPTAKMVEKPINKAVTSNDLLYAQPIANGFQIVDTEPKKVMILLNTGKADIYIVKGQDAIVYKEGNDWVYASSGSDGPKMKKLQLKF